MCFCDLFVVHRGMGVWHVLLLFGEPLAIGSSPTVFVSILRSFLECSGGILGFAWDFSRNVLRIFWGHSGISLLQFHALIPTNY